jgi:hypothetical protein
MTRLTIPWEAIHIYNILANRKCSVTFQPHDIQSSFLEPSVPAPIPIYPYKRERLNNHLTPS